MVINSVARWIAWMGGSIAALVIAHLLTKGHGGLWETIAVSATLALCLMLRDKVVPNLGQ